jgi:uncharacterized membrane protein
MEFSILILVHVASGILWGGGVLVTSFFLVPALLEAGPGGGAVMAGLLKRKFNPFLAVNGLLAALSGLRLYSIRFSSAWLGTSEGIVLTLGGLLAFSALFIGAARLRPLGEQMGALAQAGKHQEIPPVAARLRKLSQVQGWHVVAIILLMAGHRLAAQL